MAQSTRNVEGQAARLQSKVLAQEHTVVANVPDFDSFIHDPGMVILPSGTIVVASPCWQRGGSERRKYTLMARSFDGGKTWEQLDRLPYADAAPFYVNGRLFMFVQREHWKDVSFVASDDEGASWTPAVRIFEGPYWNCSTPMVIENGRLYWAISATNWLGMAVLCADLGKDLLDKSAWRISDTTRRPDTPSHLTTNQFKIKDDGRLNKYWGDDNWLEPNTFLVNGEIRFAARTIIDEQATANIACVGQIIDNGADLSVRFTQFAGWPGGQNKFFIMTDEETGHYWMLSNLVSDSQDAFDHTETARSNGLRGSMGNERRTLALSYSVDALNWFPAGIAAQWPGMLQSFMYPSATIDGDDIVFISRTSRYARQQHDADQTTFHRIKGFRGLAVDLTIAPWRFKREKPVALDRHPGNLTDKSVEGRWMWFDGRELRISGGGVVEADGGGLWSISKNDELEIAVFDQRVNVRPFGDGTLLTGVDGDGAEVWLVRQPN